MYDKSNSDKGSGYKKRNKRLNPKTKGKPKYKNYFLFDIEEEDIFNQEPFNPYPEDDSSYGDEENS